jgi:outer membrane protein
MLQTIRLFLAAAFFLTVVSAQAQTAPKCGHMNLGNLLESLPETTEANKQLEALVNELGVKGDSLAKAFETAAAAFQADYQAGKLTPVVAQQQYAVLEKQQAEVTAYEQKLEAQVVAKREELLKPILTKVYDAIKMVAKENGYSMVFDTSTGATLYALESEDVTALVRKKLGLQ